MASLIESNLWGRTFLPSSVLYPVSSPVVTKSNKKKTIGEVAFACYLPGSRDSEFKSPLPEGEEPGLIETSFFDPANFSFPAGYVFLDE